MVFSQGISNFLFYEFFIFQWKLTLLGNNFEKIIEKKNITY